jgi:hypothetical protein
VSRVHTFTSVFVFARQVGTEMLTHQLDGGGYDHELTVAAMIEKYGAEETDKDREDAAVDAAKKKVTDTVGPDYILTAF